MRLLALLLVLASSSSGQDDPGFKQPATLRARFLLPDGEPAPGAALRLRGWGGDPQRIRRFGAPKAWTDPVAETDAEGSAELRFVPPGAYSFSLEVELEGYAKAVWSWMEIGLAETIDLGDVRLEEMSTIVGCVVDARGNVLTRGWSGFATPLRPAESGRGSYGFSEAVDPRSGEFHLSGVPVGVVLVGARGLGAYTEPFEVEVVAGVETTVEIVYDGPDLERRIAVQPRSPFWVQPDPSAVRLIAADGSLRTAVVNERSFGLLVFDDLPAGACRVEIDDPRFEPWSQDDVRPGEQVRATLQPAGRLVLDVVDAESGRAITEYGVGTILQVTGNQTEHELLPDGSPAPADGLLAGVMPIPQTLVVRVPGRPVQRVELDGAWSEEPREVRVQVGRSRMRVGRVRGASGRAMAGVRVERTTGDREGTPFDHRRLGEGRTWLPILEQVWDTDSAGGFPFGEVAPGRHTFVAIGSPWLTTSATVELPLPPGTELALELPAAGRLAGRLLLPEGMTVDELGLEFSGEPVDVAGLHPDRRRIPGRRFESIWGRIASDGSFDLGPLPAGELAVEWRRLVLNSSGARVPERGELGPVTIRPGETTQAEWDLRTSMPGSARLRLRVEGDARGAAIVLAIGERRGEVELWSARPGASGTIRLTGLAPGSWRLALLGPGRSWGWDSTELFVVEAGRETSLALDLQLHRRRVRCLDAESGAPLVGVEVMAWTGPRGGRAGRTRGTTDDSGVLELVLPPGEARFCVATEGKLEAEDSVAVAWCAGEEVIEVRLPGSER